MMAAAQGLGSGLKGIGWYYETGCGVVAADKGEAIHWCERAVAGVSGAADCLKRLGRNVHAIKLLSWVGMCARVRARSKKPDLWIKLHCIK